MKLRDAYGHTFSWSGDYDSACRIAHFVRELGKFECFVVGEDGRAMSEVVGYNALRDIGAEIIALELLNEKVDLES